MADPAGATNYITITADRTKLAASMPDAGNTFAADLVIDQAAAINYEGGAQTFIDGLLANCTDLRVFTDDTLIEVPFGVKQFSQVAGSRKLILGLGIPSTAPLLSSADTTYRLYRGCTGGTFENKAGVVPTADGWVGCWPGEDPSGNLTDWTAGGYHGVPAGTPTYSQVGQVGGAVGCDDTADGFVVTGANLSSATYSWSLWLKPTNAGSVSCIVFNQLNAMQCYLSSLRPRYADGFVDRGATALLTVNEWNHVVWQVAGLQVSFYVNGASAGSGALVQQFAPTTFTWGGWWGDPDSQYDEMCIENLARSANWVTSYYNMTSANGAFWTVGDVVAVGGGGRIIRPMLYRSGPAIKGVIG